MSDVFEEVENIVWGMGDTALEQLTRLYPEVEIKIYPCGPLILPTNVVACCPSGVGEITPVKRLTIVSARAMGYILTELVLEEIWTSPNAVPWDNRSWDMFYWDLEKDEEVVLDAIGY